MKLYRYSGSANCYKIELALAQLGRRCERIEVEIFRGEAQAPAFLAKSPAGRVPLLELDDGATLAESNAILWHVCRGSGLLPEEPLLQSQLLGWMFFEQNSIEPVIGSARYWRLTGRDRGREDETRRRIESGAWALGVLEAHLAQRTWLVGQGYSAADIAVYAYAHLAPEVGLALERFPAVLAWCRRLEAQPGYYPGPGPYTPAAMQSQ